MKRPLAALAAALLLVSSPARLWAQSVPAGPPEPPDAPRMADPLEVGKALVKCTGKLKKARLDQEGLQDEVADLKLSIADLKTETATLRADLAKIEDSSTQRIKELEESQGFSLVNVLLIGGGVLLLGLSVGFGVGAGVSSAGGG